MRGARIGFLKVWPVLLLILLIIKMDVPLIARFSLGCVAQHKLRKLSWDFLQRGLQKQP